MSPRLRRATRNLTGIIAGVAVAATTCTGATFASGAQAPDVVAYSFGTVDPADYRDAVDGEDAGSIDRLYGAYFLRAPDAAGLAHWQSRRSGGMSLAAISEEFSSSTEFRNRYGTLNNGDFVRLVYRNVLGRTPDPGGYNHWLTNLNRGVTRGRIMTGFSDSAEFKARTVRTAPTGPAPKPAPAPTAAPDTYRFSEVDGAGTPIQWAPCTEIGVVANFSGAPAGAEAALRDSLAQLSAHQKITWVYEGTTTESYGSTSGSFERAFVDVARYGDRWSPVLVSWPATWDGPGGTVGFGGFASVAESGGPARAVTGNVALNRTYTPNTVLLTNLLLHELGHVANLGHADAADQVMSATLEGYDRLQYGDKAGLAKVGGWDTPCVPAATDPTHTYLSLDGEPAPLAGVFDVSRAAHHPAHRPSPWGWP